MSTFAAPVSPTSGLAGYALDGASPRPVASAKTLYVSRTLINAPELAAWAEEQGLGAIEVDMHATVAFSRQPLDWSLFTPDAAGLVVTAGARSVAVLGDSAVVLRFESPILAARWQGFLDAGASWDHDDYKPHVTITYAGGAIDLAAVDPFGGVLEFGPEVFVELSDDGESTVRKVAARLAKERRRMSKLNLFIPFQKIDAEQRLVYGAVATETPDRAGDIFDYETSKPFYETWSGDIAKASGGKSLGNLRAMHQNIAAGKLTQLNLDDNAKRVEICAKVVDDAEWNKVLEGVYTGFSQGGRFAKRWKDTASGKMRFTADPAEISLVDLPCLPDATFELVKAAGAVERKPFANVLEPEPAPPGNDAVIAKARELAKAAGVEEKWTNFIERGRDELLKAAGAAPRPFNDPALGWLAKPFAKVMRTRADADWMGKVLLAVAAHDKDKTTAAQTAAVDGLAFLVARPDFDAVEHEDELRKVAETLVPLVAAKDEPAVNAEDLGVKQVWLAKDGSSHMTKRAALDHSRQTDAESAAAAAAKPIEDRLGQITAALNKTSLTLPGLQEAFAKRDEAFRTAAGVAPADWKMLNDFVRERADDPLVKGVGFFPPLTVKGDDVEVSAELKASIGEFLAKVRQAPPKPDQAAADRASIEKSVAAAGASHVARRKVARSAKLAKATELLPPAWAGSTHPDRMAKILATGDARKAASLWGLANLLQLLASVESAEEDLETPCYYGSTPTVPKTVTDRFGTLVVELGDICAEVLDAIVTSMRAEETAEAMTLVASAGELVKAGARHSRGDRALLKTAHDALVGLGHDCQPAEKAASTEAMAKIAGERDAMMKRFEAMLPQLDEILKRVTNIEQQPSPRNALSFRTMSKTDEGAGGGNANSSDEMAALLANMTPDERAILMVKAAQRQPVHMSLPR